MDVKVGLPIHSDTLGEATERFTVNYHDPIEEYLAGAEQLAEAIAGMSEEQLDAMPVTGTWSTRSVVCHIADFEPVYADRMKRVIAEKEPTFFGGDPDVFAAHLAYARRDVQEELQLIRAVRGQMAKILRTLTPEDFQRQGHHSEDGPMTLKELLRRITSHIPHHVHFIEEKRKAMTGTSG
ncbi:MAG: DinB family protein [Planctomycetaceae bacterium]|nr:DinB family protein [Planctomycetaceae bacterium]MCB9953633.1 DinB family protein [Planctomycetaceae bacterium]